VEHTIRSRVSGVGAALPSRVMTNEDFSKFLDTDDEWIASRTGIRERRVLAEGESEATLAAEAARAAMQRAGVGPGDIDFVIATTYSPTRLCPAVSSEVQALLGLGLIPAFDLNAACTGFVYAIQVADALIRTGAYRNILIVSAEAQSRYLDYTDRSTCILLGDAAGAIVMSRSTNGDAGAIHSTWLGADASGSELIVVADKQPLDPSAPMARKGGPHPLFQMNGREVFKFAVRVVGPTLDEALSRAQMTADQIDLLVMHQANVRIINAAADRLGLPPEKVFVNIGKYGNTASASIPLALTEAVESGQLRPGMRVVLVGFGAGFTYGAAVLTW